METGERVIVGVNRFQMEEHTKAPVFRIDATVEREQVESLRAMRAARDAALWKQRIEALEAAARGTENVMPRIVAAAEAQATVGEISDAFRRVFGEYRETI